MANLTDKQKRLLNKYSSALKKADLAGELETALAGGSGGSVAPPTGNTVWHVNPHVLTTGNGSAGSPFKTVLEAETAGQVWDTIYIAGATFSNLTLGGARFYKFQGLSTFTGPITLTSAVTEEDAPITGGLYFISDLFSVVTYSEEDPLLTFVGEGEGWQMVELENSWINMVDGCPAPLALIAGDGGITLDRSFVDSSGDGPFGSGGADQWMVKMTGEGELELKNGSELGCGDDSCVIFEGTTNGSEIEIDATSNMYNESDDHPTIEVAAHGAGGMGDGAPHIVIDGELENDGSGGCLELTAVADDAYVRFGMTAHIYSRDGGVPFTRGNTGSWVGLAPIGGDFAITGTTNIGVGRGASYSYTTGVPAVLGVTAVAGQIVEDELTHTTYLYAGSTTGWVTLS